MSVAPDLDDPKGRIRFLRNLGASGAAMWPIGEAALALAAFDRLRMDLGGYRDHLRLLARDVSRHPRAAGDLTARARALSEAILLKHGYRGDEETYEDLQNASLIRVVDRRKGLPVALGILFIDAARAQHWEISGLAFPGHFLVCLANGPERLILDPFHRGRICQADELRHLLKVLVGTDRKLAPEHCAPVSDRDVLLRLQNNLKSRLLQSGQPERAAAVVGTMLMLAPDLAELWHEAGQLHRQLGNVRAAAKAFEQYILRAPDGIGRHRAAAVLQQLRARLN